MTRQSGLILHPTCLPGPGGIGTLGSHARAFIDFLAESEQQVWQILPLGPTGLGNSPYMATSAFAGNPLLIDLQELVDEGWLEAQCADEAPPTSVRVDFGAVIVHKERCLTAAWDAYQRRATDRQRADHDAFVAEHAEWLEDFALFTALGRATHHAPWSEWPRALRVREPAALEAARVQHANAMARIRFEQFVFERQWNALHDYARAKQVSIVGDVPIFVAGNSADVWANPELFVLDDEGLPTVVAGVPPDYFAEKGQLWGNPLYRWDVLAERDYAWWVARFRRVLGQVDTVRIDHFRGFAAYWEVKADREDAMEGRWVPGPGRALFDRVREELGDIPVIAEDLGIITPEVEALRDALGLPGMKVLHFGFGGDSLNPHLPHNHVPRCVVYPGTHDNDTTLGWYQQLDQQAADHVRIYLHIDGRDIAWQLLVPAWASVAELAVANTQDILGLGSEHRMNTPGVADGNWEWRLTEGQLSVALALRLRSMTRRYGRSAVTDAPR